MATINPDDFEQVKSEMKNAFSVREKIAAKYFHNSGDLLYCEKDGKKAVGKYLPGKEHVVFCGSYASKEDSQSFYGTSSYNLKKELIKDGVLKDHDVKSYVFTQDYIFGSPSAASSVVLGRQSNGWTSWLDLKGQSIDSSSRKDPRDV